MKKSISIRLIIAVLFYCCLSAVLLAQGATESVTKKARDHIALFQYDQAMALLKQATQLEPDNWEPFYLAGTVLLRQKKPVEAESFLVKAHQLNNQETDIQKALGALYINMAKDAQNAGRPAEMNEYLLKACRAYPSGTKIWQTLLENWWKNNEFEKIKQEGDLIIKGNAIALEQADDKNLQAALIIVSRAFYRENDFASAEKFLNAASRIRHANDELFAMRREIRNKSEQERQKVVEAAEKYYNEGNYGKALELLNEAEKMPGARVGEIAEKKERIEREAKLKQSLARSDDLSRAGKFEEALGELQELAAAYPAEEEVSTRLKKITTQVEKDRAEKARVNVAQIEEKKKLIELNRRFDNFIKEAREKEKRGSFDIAISDYENALKIRPEDKEIPQKIVELRKKSVQVKARQDSFQVSFAAFDNDFKVNKFTEAYTAGKKLLADYEEHRKAVAPQFAETCLRLEKYDEAREALRYIETEDEHKDLYNYVKGMAAYHSGDNALALEHFGKLRSGFRSDVNTTRFWIYLYKVQIGIYILLLVMLFPAIKAGKEILANWKTSSKLKKIESIKESGEYEANIAFLQERYDKEDTPNPKQVAVMLAEALLRTGNSQRAYELVSALLKKDSRNPNARRIAGEACLLLEDTTPTGLEHIQGLLKIDETRKDVINYLAYAYIKQQADHKMAQDFILKAISLNPSDSEAVIYLADLYIKRQVYSQQSFKILERAIKIAPDVPGYYVEIIETCYRLDNPQEAERWREMATARFPAEPAFSGQPGRESTKATRPANVSTGSMPDYASIGNDTPGGMPDYENIGNDTPGGLPDYGNIGNDNSGGMPDYESIGNTPPGEMPDYESIGNDSEDSGMPSSPFPDIGIKPTPPARAPISGPQKTCPHCNTVNAIKEYYCINCGKPFTG
ncbi:MAG: hypothetical protein CVV42_13605 [Candidatus Riflebacteria bacterium HGW-Riflebacteria-2]|jgi:tetratricopeptide (TPR) repeat protein|nr:MAG: hypothetical protein CVV42_13605 [Candidatus Riflebacteria bacterium HGW-Riflebacteria-2]